MAYNEEDFLQLSGLQHFRFCRRRWALIHIEHQWTENYRTKIFGKLSNGAASIQRTLRDHAPRVADCGLENAAANLRAMLPQVLAAADLDTLRGIEGAAAGSLPPRRLGRLSVVFMEVMLCWC